MHPRGSSDSGRVDIKPAHGHPQFPELRELSSPISIVSFEFRELYYGVRAFVRAQVVIHVFIMVHYCKLTKKKNWSEGDFLTIGYCANYWVVLVALVVTYVTGHLNPKTAMRGLCDSARPSSISTSTPPSATQQDAARQLQELGDSIQNSSLTWFETDLVLKRMLDLMRVLNAT